MCLVAIEAPRTRTQGSPLETIGRYNRRTSEIDEMVTSACVQGVSTRDMARSREALMGEGFGRSTVSRATQRLAESVEQLRSARITEGFPYLFLDATFINACWVRAVENVSVLVAYGVNDDGKRRLLAVTLGSEESEASRTALLEGVLERGLSGLQLVVSDAHAGLIKAVRRLLPDVAHQRCTVHLMRNVLAKTPHRLRGRVGSELSRVFQATSHQNAQKALEEFAAGLGSQIPEAPPVFGTDSWPPRAPATTLGRTGRGSAPIRAWNASTPRSNDASAPSAPSPIATALFA